MSAADVSYGWRKLRHKRLKNRTRIREKMAYLIKMISFLDFEFDSIAFAIDHLIGFDNRKALPFAKLEQTEINLEKKWKTNQTEKPKGTFRFLI